MIITDPFLYRHLLHHVHSFSSTNQSNICSRPKAGVVFTQICCLDVEDLGWKNEVSAFISTLGQTNDGCFLTDVIRNVRVGLS